MHRRASFLLLGGWFVLSARPSFKTTWQPWTELFEEGVAVQWVIGGLEEHTRWLVKVCPGTKC